MHRQPLRDSHMVSGMGERRRIEPVACSRRGSARRPYTSHPLYWTEHASSPEATIVGAVLRIPFTETAGGDCGAPAGILERRRVSGSSETPVVERLAQPCLSARRSRWPSLVLGMSALAPLAPSLAALLMYDTLHGKTPREIDSQFATKP